MRISVNKALPLVLFPFFVSGCIDTASNPTVQQGTILVNEVVTVCGAMVGGEAEQRINEEWAKYPDAEASRPMIESVAEVLLNDPTVPQEQRTSNYKKYLTCAAGLFATKQAMQ